ncbi:hypothetical protein GQ55_3G255700 [Panicum hallii var. hallii]|uniref:Uncharacterized protein n=1 Tax=Panicum hallii var. hallii TaxID=1504633 RepID=A0A2T7EDB6_9POAL|nr:hypothetical protein GQ55_3G255700 [Panicum hallii var. hallii]
MLDRWGPRRGRHDNVQRVRGQARPARVRLWPSAAWLRRGRAGCRAARLAAARPGWLAADAAGCSAAGRGCGLVRRDRAGWRPARLAAARPGEAVAWLGVAGCRGIEEAQGRKEGGRKGKRKREKRQRKGGREKRKGRKKGRGKRERELRRRLRVGHEHGSGRPRGAGCDGGERGLVGGRFRRDGGDAGKTGIKPG